MERIKVIWTFNPITVMPILGAIVGGTIYINTIQNQVEGQGTKLTSVVARLETMSDLPYRMGQQEAVAKAANDRMDRIADLMMSGQDATRKDLGAFAEAIRKDIGTLSTKVEVIGSKVDMMNGKPSPTSFGREGMIQR
ncbi:hypothetical protein J2T08_000576 [Neorhizobium galegae]|uniref:hypothetical protein n=1 Tax=Neorhizobium galegae TaxID=399 RepID=UPI002785C8C0|nr:hypothetical protein [Neorhizobium galegae]MDQ0132675.1 hypothetical protein [Neorhizobium galegae]